MHDTGDVVLLYCLLFTYEHSKASCQPTFQHTVTLVYLLELKLFSIHVYVCFWIHNKHVLNVATKWFSVYRCLNETLQKSLVKMLVV